MSNWTHICGAIYVDTFKEEVNIKSWMEEQLKGAPRITGSEQDADIFVNVPSGHNTWTSCDCDHCKYGKTIKRLAEGGFECGADESFECPEGKYQTRVVISIVGDLRDRSGNITRKELKEFLKYIENIDGGCSIDYSAINIYDETGVLMRW
ncbi:MAG: hypothetical protein ACI4U9_03320 [Clostridia bacterium]